MGLGIHPVGLGRDEGTVQDMCLSDSMRAGSSRYAIPPHFYLGRSSPNLDPSAAPLPLSCYIRSSSLPLSDLTAPPPHSIRSSITSKDKRTRFNMVRMVWRLSRLLSELDSFQPEPTCNESATKPSESCPNYPGCGALLPFATGLRHSFNDIQVARSRTKLTTETVRFRPVPGIARVATALHLST